MHAKRRKRQCFMDRLTEVRATTLSIHAVVKAARLFSPLWQARHSLTRRTALSDEKPPRCPSAAQRQYRLAANAGKRPKKRSRRRRTVKLRRPLRLLE
jgi:hypothetical protein